VDLGSRRLAAGGINRNLPHGDSVRQVLLYNDSI